MLALAGGFPFLGPVYTAHMQAAGVLVRCGAAGWLAGVVSVAGSRRWGQVGVGCVCVGGGALRVWGLTQYLRTSLIYIFFMVK